MEKKTKRKLTLDRETVRRLADDELQVARGGVLCSTGAFTGTCPPPATPACPKTK